MSSGCRGSPNWKATIVANEMMESTRAKAGVKFFIVMLIG